MLSGAIMAATSIPQLIAYAETVGYAGYRGLATAGPPLLAWGLVTGSPFMNAGVTSLTALMAKSDLNGDQYVLEHGEEAYVPLVAAYSLWIGTMSFILAFLGFGKLAGKVPKPVLNGFKWGCAVGVLVSAVPNGLFKNGAKELNKHVGFSFIGETVWKLKRNFPGAVNMINFWYVQLKRVFFLTTVYPFVWWSTVYVARLISG
jgi:MFS superfamily sulfate permease-like transporter